MTAMTLDLPTPDGAAPPILTRRGLAAAALFAGYAASARPVNAAAITTDSAGLATATVRFPAAGGFMLPAYLARPEGRGRRPAVIVMSEIFGLHAYIQDVCRRLAKAGYVALAPAYFVRAGDPATLTDIAAVRAVVNQAPNAQVMADTDAAVAWLRAQPFTAPDRLAITGFCWGGAGVWMAAAHSTAFRAGVAWYGRLVRPQGATEERPWPVDVAGRLNAPVLGLYADADAGIPQADVDAMSAALKAAGNTTSVIAVYENTGHGFHADYRPAYAPAAARAAWDQMLAWFRANGV